jgi:hypothetical protein
VSTLSILIQHSHGIPNENSKTERRYKRNTNRKKKFQVTLKDLKNSMKNSYTTYIASAK